MSDGGLLAELLKQAPGVAALIFVVLKFLSHMREVDTLRDKRHAATVADLAEKLEGTTKAGHAVQVKTVKAIEQNTAAMNALVVRLNGTGSGAGKVEA